MRRIIGLSLVALLFATAPSFAQRFNVNGRSAMMVPPFSGTTTFFGAKMRSTAGFTPVSPITGVPLTGNFVVGTQGNFSPKNISFTPATTGNSFLSGQGFFVPTNGTFLPDRNGNFVLTVRASLDPKTGTFTPSATGNFLFPTRGDLVSSMTGTTVATFTPFNPLAALASLASLSVSNPLAANPYAFNSVAASAALNPYALASASPYMSSAYQMPYVMPVQTANYGAATAPISTTSAPSSAVNTGDKAPMNVYGISIEKGHIKWPLAFKLLPPDMKDSVADRLEGELLALVGQAASGNASAGLVADASRNVARLAAWLKSHETDMAEATYTEGQTFVRTLDATLASMRY